MQRRLTQAGVTIVEVLIVTVVISTVLASCYSIAVRSLQSIQLTQERTYALKLAEGQLELLKGTSISKPQANILSKSNNYCLNVALNSYDNPGLAKLPANDDYTSFPAQCKKDPNNGSCSGYCYYFGIIPDVANHNYTAYVRWEGSRGNAQQVQLAYRIYP